MNREPADSNRVFEPYLLPFAELPRLRANVLHVLIRLPEDIQNDFLGDTHFKVSVDDCQPGKGRIVLMPELGANGASRCVVLKPRLENRHDNFARYIVAHEFAHAHLYNGGWGKITDPEEAADALAASWGFPKVAR